jgi:hypothetical protein
MSGVCLFGLPSVELSSQASRLWLLTSSRQSVTALRLLLAVAVRCVSRLFLTSRSSRKVLRMSINLQEFLNEVKGLQGEEAKQAEIAYMKQVIEQELRKAFATQKKKNDAKSKKAKI